MTVVIRPKIAPPIPGGIIIPGGSKTEVRDFGPWMAKTNTAMVKTRTASSERKITPANVMRKIVRLWKSFDCCCGGFIARTKAPNARFAVHYQQGT